MGGFTSSSQSIIDILRQKSRPYLFSNSLAPCIVGAGLKAFEILDSSNLLRNKLHENTNYFRTKMSKLGFDLLPGNHPIVPIMLYDAGISQDFSKKLLKKGDYVVGFFFPVVPKKLARIRVQLSASHTPAIRFCTNAFEEVGKELKII